MTDFALLGLPDLDLSLPFMELFETHFAHRLMHRAEGFRAIFQNLPEDPLIIETGCLRALDNWGGDGQSTFLFDLLTQMWGGKVSSFEILPENIAIAEKVCEKVDFIVGDAATNIHRFVTLEPNITPLIDLLYLDSFDHGRDVSVIPAPVHYMLEFCAAWPGLRPGSIIAIDDYPCAEINDNSKPGTKGLAVNMFLEKVGAQVLHDGHQKVWRL